MERESYTFKTVLFILVLSLSEVLGQQQVDLSGQGCDAQGAGYTLTDEDDLVQLYHTPQYNTQSTRDRCDVVIHSRPGTRIQWIVGNIRFDECGVEITLYDNPNSDTFAIKSITCADAGLQYKGKTRDNYLRIRIRKPTPKSRRFDFQMRAKDDRGPSLEYESLQHNYLGQGLEPGIVVGIGMAGAILIVALVLLAIYLCIRARKASLKDDMGPPQSSVYTSGGSQVLFAGTAPRQPRGRYGSMEDIRSSASTQNQAEGAYANPSYTTGPGEKRSERSASIGRKKGAGFANTAYSIDSSDFGNTSWEERENISRGGPERRSRKDAFDANGKKVLKSAMKKKGPEEYEMNRVNNHPSGILKSRGHSPSRSYTSTEGSVDANAMIHGYGHSKSKAQQPNVHHLPVLERRRSGSRGTRSNHSTSSLGRSHSRDRSRSSDRKKKPQKPPKNSRMYNEDVFMDDSRRRSGSRSSRPRSNSLRSKKSDRESVVSDSTDNSYASSRRVNMNPGGKRVQIKGTETDL